MLTESAVPKQPEELGRQGTNRCVSDVCEQSTSNLLSVLTRQVEEK